MKGERGLTLDHVVPLSSLAICILKEQEAVRVSDAIFPGQNELPISYSAFAKAPIWKGLDVATAHGWRSVFADACRERLRIATDLKEAALAHSLKNVEAAYTRETLIEGRRPVMEAYANWLMGASVDVIAFPARA